MQLSILTPSFNRSDLLHYGLSSIAKQEYVINNKNNMEVIILDDGYDDGKTKKVAEAYKDKLNINYVFTGERHRIKPMWRMPGFAINIGSKIAKGNLLMINDAEMFHSDSLIQRSIEPFISCDYKCKLMVIPHGIDDLSSSILNKVKQYDDGIFRNEYLNMGPALNTRMPFTMTIRKSDFIDIGGYDEDFTGMSMDDDDITDRLLQYGCEYKYIYANTIHLYHDRALSSYINNGNAVVNQTIYRNKKGILYRNQNKEWGILK